MTEAQRICGGIRTDRASWRPLAWRLLLAAMLSAPMTAAAQAETLAEHFSKFDPGSTVTIDHGSWDGLLKTYLSDCKDGLNCVDYTRFKAEGAGKLKLYLSRLQATDVAKLNRPEQFAFWANLYNAKTVDIVLDHYPVESIRDIRLTNFLLPGPWREKVVKVDGVELSLDDIEHQIMRPLFKDPRVHYAVNCAAVGCPNLAKGAFTGATLETMLDAGARAFVNSPRGLRFDGGELVASKIYSWFDEDFGDSETKVLEHVRRYAGPELGARLKDVTRIDDYAYDWRLNDAKR